MRRLAAAILAVPVIASIYVATLVAVPGARKYFAAIGASLLVGIVGIGLPAPVDSVPPSSPQPVLAAQLQPVVTVPADPSSEEAAAVPGLVAVRAPSRVTVGAGVERPSPVTAAIPDDLASPIPIARVATAVVTVRVPTSALMAASLPAGNRVKLTSTVVLKFDRAVTLKQVRASFAIKPAIKGTIRALNNRTYTFTPANPLAANTPYTISLTKVIKDTDGVEIAAPDPLRLLTAAAPALVRFRPTKGTEQVDPTQLVSVRFTQSMNHSTTAKAFSVVVAGKKVAGSITWAENDTVLVFKPAKVLVKGTGVGIRLSGTATSVDGVPIKKGGSATFRVVDAPKAALTAARPTPKPVARPKPGSGGGSLGGGSWAAAEAYYLKLMNCTRTGGLVTSSGRCSSPGGRNVAPLWIDQGISSRVSRPYAKYLATRGICSHFADGNPGNRLKRAGYGSYRWAENISCPKTMAVMPLMVYTQQYFQAERSYGGGHYVNLMNPLYDRVGIGVWVSHGRAEVVIDFYRP